MSKRDRVEKEIELEKKLEVQKGKINEILKEASQKQKEKNKHYTYESFLTIPYFEEFRDKTQWKRKSYNKEKQFEEYMTYLYFKYEAPIWAIKYVEKIYSGIYNLLNRNSNLKNVDKIAITYVEKELEKEQYIYCVTNKELFFNIMKGNSLKELLSHLLTKIEIHYFLNSKEEYILKALIDAKLKKFKLNPIKHKFLIKRFSTINLFDGKHDVFIDLLMFFAKNDLNEDAIQEVYDYFTTLYRHNLRNNSYLIFENKTISSKDFFKKSVNTIIQLSNEFHINQIKSKENKFVEWERTFNDINTNKYSITELTNSKDLINEGRILKHCVGSYASKCLNGQTKILSLSGFDDYEFKKLLTIEVYHNTIVQVRGKLNRLPTENEKNALLNFANELNLRYII